MREIKFRIFRRRDEKMFYKPVECDGSDGGGVCFVYHDEDSIYTDSWQVIVEGLKDIQGDDNYALMQYTGLKDKNGKEIYEGDVVELQVKHWSYDWKNPRAVEFENGCFRPWGTGDWEYPPGKYKVIGNIYENPELLNED